MTTINNTAKKVDEFANEIGLSFSSSEGELVYDGCWKAYQYTVTLARGGSVMTLDFKQGVGVKELPSLAVVLECVLSDINGINDMTFEEWANDFGYDSDSRSAESIFNACKKEYDDLNNLLTKDEQDVFYQIILDAYFDQ